MSKDLTETLLLKRSTKKKSGYSVSEEDSVYYVGETPSKARVSLGDRVVGINGISADDFLDEDDANGLIESIRIVVVPKDKIDEYDRIYQGDNGENTIYKCMHCDHLNEDLEPDEDGDLVCQECGHVMEPDVIHFCDRCDHENKNLERDDEGDLVCQQCGHVIEESREVRSVVPIDVHVCLSVFYHSTICQSNAQILICFYNFERNEVQ
jgi:DNA-directed RNA polymerase subunit RPC12/RpoP